jgi:prophage antirepressor-like protein
VATLNNDVENWIGAAVLPAARKKGKITKIKIKH